MTGFIIVLICVAGSIAWGISAGRKRRRELDQQEGRVASAADADDIGEFPDVAEAYRGTRDRQDERQS